MVRPGPTQCKKRERERLGFLGRPSAQPDPVGLGPTHIIIY